MDPSSAIAESLGLMLRRGFRLDLYRRLTDGVADGLDATTYPVLSAVDQLGPASAGALAGRIGLDRSVVSRRAGLLAERGLLTLDGNPADARQVLLALTPAGRDAIARTQERLTGSIADRMHDWPPEDRVRFADLLLRFAVADPDPS